MDDKSTKLILNAIVQMNTNISKINSNISEINTHISEIDTHINKIDTHISEIDTHISHIDARLDAHDENFRELKTQLNSLENCVTRLETIQGEKAQIALEYISGAMNQHEEIQKTLNQINSKLDNHDIHIEVLEEKVL